MLIRYVMLWPSPLIPWPWNFVVDRVSRGYVCSKFEQNRAIRGWVIRQPDVSRNALPCFLQDSYTSTSRSSRPSNVYHRFDGRAYSILPYSSLPHPSPNFTEGGGSKSVKFGLDFDTTLATVILKRSNILGIGAAMMELCSLQIWESLVHLLLRSRVWKYAHLKKLLNRQ